MNNKAISKITQYICLVIAFFCVVSPQVSSAQLECKVVIAQGAKEIFLPSPNTIKNQKCFRSCVPTAHTSLIEHIYFRKTGKKIDLSENYLFLSYLISKALSDKKKGLVGEYSFLGIQAIDYFRHVKKLGLLPTEVFRSHVNFKRNKDKLPMFFLNLLAGNVDDIEQVTYQDFLNFTQLFFAQDYKEFVVNGETFSQTQFTEHVSDVVGEIYLHGLIYSPLRKFGDNTNIHNKIVSELRAKKPVLASVRRNKKSLAHSRHAVIIVGFELNEDGELLRYIIQNSWGLEWGKQGYSSIYLNKENQYFNLNAVSLPITDNEFYEMYDVETKTAITLYALEKAISYQRAQADLISNSELMRDLIYDLLLRKK